jgi:hypothetical protein
LLCKVWSQTVFTWPIGASEDIAGRVFIPVSLCLPCFLNCPLILFGLMRQLASGQVIDSTPSTGSPALTNNYQFIDEPLNFGP